MSESPSSSSKPLRLWPGITLAAIQLLANLVVPRILPDFSFHAIMASLLAGVLVLVWWLFFSRAPWGERLLVLGLTIASMIIASQFTHVSIATAMMGSMYFIASFPYICLGLVVWAAFSRRVGKATRWLSMVATIFITCGAWLLLRTEGMSGDGSQDLKWRWSKTTEERVMETIDNDPIAANLPEITQNHPVSWPGFRGANRDSKIHGIKINTDWSASPPIELWRRDVGPGISSFAAWGDLFYTQEQRGDQEVVACYQINTGEPVWRHHYDARFWDSHVGAGPRATPTLDHGQAYTLGATGILTTLNAMDGTLVWSRNAIVDTEVDIPDAWWGIASSPLAHEDKVIVSANGRLIAYDRTDGEIRWIGPENGGSYSSPHLMTIDGIAQILQMSWSGVLSVDPNTGQTLWKHEWPGKARIVQPALTSNGELLISGGESRGMRRIAAKQEAGEWNVEVRWTTNKLKPYFSDFVVHKGQAIGFDSGVLGCIDASTGKRNWKGGRYGSGQLFLLADQDILLVQTEQGDLTLVSANPDAFSEIARFPVLEGKTWNHPILVGDTLLVRNDHEIAAFKLALSIPPIAKTSRP